MANKHLSWFISFVLILPFNVAMAFVPELAKEQRHTIFFGIITKNLEGEEGFEVTNRVPLVEGQSYGWIIRLGSEFAKVKWREVFELPARPETWGNGEESGQHEITEDGKISITEKEVFVRDGYIQNFWSVAAGDPLGDYVIRVYLNEVLLRILNFKVVRHGEP